MKLDNNELYAILQCIDYVDDHDASDDWGWVPKYDLQGMTKRMIAELRSISE